MEEFCMGALVGDCMGDCIGEFCIGDWVGDWAGDCMGEFCIGDYIGEFCMGDLVGDLVAPQVAPLQAAHQSCPSKSILSHSRSPSRSYKSLITIAHQLAHQGVARPSRSYKSPTKVTTHTVAQWHTSRPPTLQAPIHTNIPPLSSYQSSHPIFPKSSTSAPIQNFSLT